jgi:CRP-like cAMP-binding protein
MSTADQIIDPEWHNVFREEHQAEERLEDALGRIPIFGLLSPRELRLVGRIVHIRTFKKGETIIRRGVEQSGLYLIRTGSVHIVRRTMEGEREVVGTLYSPELLGEFALLDGTPRSSSIVAAETVQLIGFFKPDLMDILVTKPALGCKILLRLAEEMNRSLRKDYGRLQEAGFPFPEEVEQAPGIDPTAV